MKMTFVGRVPIELLPLEANSRLIRVIFPSPHAYQHIGCELELVSASSLRVYAKNTRKWADKLEECATGLDQLE